VASQDVASGGASREVRLRDASDRPWPAGSAAALPATGTRSSAKTAKTAGQLGEALIRLSEDTELVAQGKTPATIADRRSRRGPPHRDDVIQ